jgi:hypothetical protein
MSTSVDIDIFPQAGLTLVYGSPSATHLLPRVVIYVLQSPRSLRHVMSRAVIAALWSKAR